MSYKNIRIAKRGGGTRLQRVRVLASGKYRFVKNLTKSKSSKKSKSKSKNKMANKKGSRVIHIPLALTGGLVGSLSTKAPSGNTIIGRIMKGDIEGAAYDAKEIYTGVDANGQFQIEFLKKGWLPIIIGAVLHIAASKLGINRALYRAQKGMPIKIGL